MIPVEKLIFVLVMFLVTVPVWWYGYRSCRRELKKIDHDATIANVRTEPDERTFRKLFEAPTDQFQRVVQNAEDCRRRVVRRRLIAFRVVGSLWLVLVVVACLLFFCSCTSTRTITNNYSALIDSVRYEFKVTQAETIDAKKQ